MAKLNYGPAYPQSQPSGRFPGSVIISSHVVSSISRAPHTSNSDSEPGTTLADKSDTIEMGKVPVGPYGL